MGRELRSIIFFQSVVLRGCKSPSTFVAEMQLTALDLARTLEFHPSGIVSSVGS